MKKFIFMFITMISMVIGSANAQEQSNYAGSSKFTDNWSVTLQAGGISPFSDFMKKCSATPAIMVGVDKYVNPWLGFGVDGRVAIGVGSSYNSPTAFDAINVSANAKVNILNLANFTGERRAVEPVLYAGIGAGRETWAEVSHHNYVTFRTGVELNLNVLDRQKAWGLVFNPSVVWGDVKNGKLNRHNGNLEVMVGVVYRFKNSNGKRTFSKAHLYDAAEVAALNARIAELEAREPAVIEKVVEKEVTVTVPVVEAQSTYVAAFVYNSDKLSDESKATLDKIATGTTVTIDAYASREPRSNKAYNVALSTKRAEAVKSYLESRGVTVNSAVGHGCDDNFGRVAVVTLVK